MRFSVASPVAIREKSPLFPGPVPGESVPLIRVIEQILRQLVTSGARGRELHLLASVEVSTYDDTCYRTSLGAALTGRPECGPGPWRGLPKSLQERDER